MLLRSSTQQLSLNLPNYLQLKNGIFAVEPLPANVKFYFSPTDKDPCLTFANPDFAKLVVQLRSCLSDTPIQRDTCYWVAYIRSARSAKKANLAITVENGQLCFATERLVEKGQELLVHYPEAFVMAKRMFGHFDESRTRPQQGNVTTYIQNEPSTCCFCRNFTPSSMSMSWPKYCDLCNANLFSELNLRMHIAKEHCCFFQLHSILPWNCCHCSLNFSLARELLSHLALHSTSTEAGQGMTCASVDKLQIVTNVVEGRFQLAEENGINGSRAEKNPVPCNHSTCQNCSCRGRYRCPMCYKLLAKLQQMANHVRSHGTKSPSTCKVCKQPLKSARDAKLHIEMKHKTVDGVYRCSSCQKSYATRSRLEGHVRYAHPGLLLKCTVCKRGFTRSDKLKRHLLTHMATALYSCSQCKQAFKRRDNLKAHYQRMHQTSRSEPVRPPPENLSKYIYKCLKCNKGFKRRGMLIYHLKRKHPGEDIKNIPELNVPLLRFNYWFPCDLCAQQFSTAKKRLMHAQKEHPNSCLVDPNVQQRQPSAVCLVWPVQCPVCPQQYARKASLTKHISKLHPEWKPETGYQVISQAAFTDQAGTSFPYYVPQGVD